jgi:hypothetical protein
MRSWTRCRSNPRLPITHTNANIKQEMTNATLLRTQVTPNDCGIRRGSGCSLRAPCPNSRLRRWLCLTRRGRWPDHLPSSCSLRWWHPLFTAECEESRSHAERSADECSTPPPHPGGVPPPSWDIPFHLVGLELILLPIGQEVVDRVLQSALVAMEPRCDGLPGGTDNSIAARSPESWSLVSAEDSGSKENLYDGLELHPP